MMTTCLREIDPDMLDVLFEDDGSELLIQAVGVLSGDSKALRGALDAVHFMLDQEGLPTSRHAALYLMQIILNSLRIRDISPDEETRDLLDLLLRSAVSPAATLTLTPTRPEEPLPRLLARFSSWHSKLLQGLLRG